MSSFEVDQQRLRESEERYRTLFESMDEGFCILQLIFDEHDRPIDYRYIEINPVFEKQTGMKNALGKTIRELVPDIEPFWFDVYGKVALTREPRRFEDHAASMGRWFDVYAFPIGLPAERRVAVLFTDITERKKNEAALRESERLQRLIAQAGELAAEFPDVEEFIAAISQRVGRELGVSRCGFGSVELDTGLLTILKDYHSDLPSIAGVLSIAQYMAHFREDGLAGHTAIIEDVASHPRTAGRFESLFAPIQVRAHLTVPLHAHGSWVALFWASHHEPRRWQPAEVQLMKAVAERVWNIVERKRAEAALRQANQQLVEADRRKNEFLAVLSHELRNPLAPIRNSVYVMDRVPPGGAQARHALKVIDRQVTQLSRLIDDLLDLTRISRGKIRLQRESSLLNEIVRATGEDFREIFLREGIAFSVRIAPQPLRAFVDRTRIAQVIGNLLQNAAKFTPRGERVTLSLELIGPAEAVIQVRDTGAGIEREILQRLFQPFVQADATLDRSKGGLGLGLALAQGLVELQGGSVSGRSEGAGTGAEFTVVLPLEQTQAPAAVPTPPGPASRAPRTLRVLLIDDNLDAAESLQDALQISGHQTQIATTGLEGIAKARAFHPEVVVCDIGLPDIDGFEVARRMRADPSLSGTSLVALSGYAAPEDLQRSREAGFVQHVAKPPDLDTLETTLLEAVTQG